MPRPTAAQLVYGSATVVLSALAMLLLSRTTSGLGVAVIVCAALAIGLLVSVTVTAPARARARSRTARTGAPTLTPLRTPEPATVGAPSDTEAAYESRVA
jgi:hypothetical protein